MPASSTKPLRRTLAALVLGLALIGPGAAHAAVVGNPSAPAPAGPLVDPDLCAVAGTTDLPGAPGTPIWGFALRPTPTTDCATVTPQMPGPVLEVPAGASVVLNVTNGLDKPLEMTIPGLTFDPGPTRVGPAETVPITFTAPPDPGTYLYSSVGDAGRQQLMGLYGALLVCSSTPCPSSGSEAGSAYDRAATLVLSEIDAAFNSNPDGFSMNDYGADYWLINGQPHTDASSDISAGAGNRVLLRYLSAGPENVTMTMLGMRGRLLARDAFALTDPIDVVSETVPAGSTADMIATVPSGAVSGTRLPVYNRQLRLNNGSLGNPQFGPPDGGGMMTFIHVP